MCVLRNMRGRKEVNSLAGLTASSQLQGGGSQASPEHQPSSSRLLVWICINRQSPTSLRPAQAPRPTVSRVSDLLGVGARACASVSFKRANQRSRRPSRPLPLYFPFSATPSSRIPPRPPRTPIGRPAERPLPNFGLQLAGRERARRTPRAVRADVTGRGTARGAHEGARPVGGYKRAAVRARQA